MSTEASYADIAAMGPKQTPEEAAAPQPPQIETSTTASTSSLVDVDAPSVRTVPSDFAEQEVQTDTQAERLEREAEAAKAAAEEKARRARDKAKAKAHRADDWLVSRISSMSDGAASALAVGNLAAVMGLGAVLGYKAWGLWERRALNAKVVGLGVGLVGLVGLGESIFARAWYKAKGKKQ
ncbi:hypothetical protein PgNI_11184 [Pyricularia grisea]|uniref:Mitochondrial outer membrane protein OM14 C-terminal domain-containing protein n=1 Tax=Pyricularia grisea TaxID=148305 RepID=A0A6P8APX0_PYRGI|nr:hypothetical protein PgNI_11184 [Pyricularia grisea]TLD04076.1 hypothetical protein PgNI_11184 [Pyricularia grisea]